MQLLIKNDIYVRVMILTWLLHILLIGGSHFLLRVVHDRASFPGEKMFEELLNAEEIHVEHVYPKIHVGRAISISEQRLMAVLIELEECNLEELKQKLIDIANGRWSLKESKMLLHSSTLIIFFRFFCPKIIKGKLLLGVVI